MALRASHQVEAVTHRLGAGHHVGGIVGEGAADRATRCLAAASAAEAVPGAVDVHGASSEAGPAQHTATPGCGGLGRAGGPG